MIAILVPFFLACHVTIDEPWEYGPEFVFKVDIASSMAPVNFAGPFVNMSVAADLLCRPKEPDALLCHLKNGMMNAWAVQDVAHKGNFSGPAEDLIAEPFEAVFNDMGAEYLIVPRDSARYKQNILRSVMNKFTFGVNAKDLPDGSYDLESTKLEPCTGRLHVTRYPSSIPQERAALNRTYRFVPLAKLGKEASENIQIIKQRSVGKCPAREPFVFDNVMLIGDTEKASPAAKFLDEHVNYSSSMLTVTDIDFRSYTKNKGTINLLHVPGMIEVTEIIGVYFVRVQAAEGEMPEVPRAAKTSIFYNSKIEEI